MRIYYWNKTDNSEIYELWHDIFQDSINFCNYYFKEKLLDNKVIVLEKNKKVVSMIHLNPYKISLLGLKINSEYIVGASTKKNYRNKGYLKELLIKSITDMYKSLTEFTFLTTVDENIYNRYDFRYISSYFHSEFTDLKTHPNPLIAKATPMNLTPCLFDKFLIYYNRKMKTSYDGYIARDSYYMERILKEMNCENGFIKLFYKNEEIKGYMMIYIYESNIQIREMTYDDEILGDIISYMQIMLTENKTIRLIYPKHLEYIFQYYFNSYSEIRPYIMARLVYIKTFLERIRAESLVDINIHILDSVINQNNQTFNWRLSTDFSYLIETDIEEDIVINIGTLTQWLSGYISIEELISLNQIEIKNKNIVSDLRAITTYNAIFINEVV